MSNAQSRRGFLRLAFGALGVAAALSVPAALTAPIRRRIRNVMIVTTDVTYWCGPKVPNQEIENLLRSLRSARPGEKLYLNGVVTSVHAAIDAIDKQGNGDVILLAPGDYP